MVDYCIFSDPKNEFSKFPLFGSVGNLEFSLKNAYSSQPPKSNTHLTRTLRDFEKSYKNHLTRTRRFALRIFRFPTENIGKRPENATKSVSETKPPKNFRLRRQKTFYSVTEILILMVSRFFWQRGQNPLNSNTHLSRTNS